jgi:hypothetical protein
VIGRNGPTMRHALGAMTALALLAAGRVAADPNRGGGFGREMPSPSRPPVSDAMPESAPAPPAPAGSPQAVKPEEPVPPPVTEPIAADEAVGILGKKAHGPAGEDMGLVVDVLVDADGRPRAAVIDFGGFLGVGSRKIAVDWQTLRFRPADRASPVLLGLARADVQAAPEYKPFAPQPAAVVQPPPPSLPSPPSPPSPPASSAPAPAQAPAEAPATKPDAPAPADAGR